MALNSLAGKVALVTGAGRGIGQATAVALSRLGADVALAARSRAELDTTADLVRAQGTRAEVFPIDLSDRDAALKLADAIQASMGKIHILINNAGVVGPFGPTWTLDPFEWETALKVNLLAPFLLVRTILPSMLEGRWGRIINVSSGVVRNPQMRGGAYAASKAGLDTWTRQLGFELDGTGVTISTIYPGAIDTAMSASVRAQGSSVVGQIAQRMTDAVAAGTMPGPDYPARLISAILLTDDPTLNGEIVDIQTPQGQQLLSLLPAEQ